MLDFIKLTQENIVQEHICCAISDKKATQGVTLKKEWLTREFNLGFVFRRLDARAKVFIEYGPSENAWAPLEAENYLLIQCFWVAGSYKGKGNAKTLLSFALEDAKNQNKDGVIIITGIKKFHFLSDRKWFLKNGFEEVDTTQSGFCLLAYKINKNAKNPLFKNQILSGECDHKDGLTVYYSHRCPFTDYYVNTVLKESAEKRKIPLTIIHISTKEEAQNSYAPSSIFSLFYQGKFLTTDLSVCLEAKLNKTLNALSH